MAARFAFCVRPFYTLCGRSKFNVHSYNSFKITNFSQAFAKCLSTVPFLNLDKKLNHLVVKWDKDVTDHFPWVWLRDNCQCSLCFDNTAQSRTIDFSRFDVNTKLNNAVLLSKDIVEAEWEDGHKSKFDLRWLKKRSFRENEQKKWLLSTESMYQTWDSNGFKGIPVLNFQKVMQDDRMLLNWLKILNVSGVCLLEQVPNTLGHVGNLANRVAFIRKTHYGEEFSVQAKADATNVAYTSGYLQLHTDLPYYDYKPGINLLHCYIQYVGNGGDSLLADGFNVAEWLRKHDPATYKCLAETDVSWTDIGQENGNHFHKTHHGPVICESKSGVLRRVNYSQPQRDSHLAVPLDRVKSWYRALKKFYELALDPRNLVQFKLEPGQMVTFNNLRVLHGRTAFGSDMRGERHVQGAYIDWDEARSKIRVLEAKLKENNTD